MYEFTYSVQDNSNGTTPLYNRLKVGELQNSRFGDFQGSFINDCGPLLETSPQPRRKKIALWKMYAIQINSTETLQAFWFFPPGLLVVGFQDLWNKALTTLSLLTLTFK